MLALLADLATPHERAEAELEDARESLAYWEVRARRLPRHALRKRREARELAARWRERVAAAERARYGAGVVGLLAQLAIERRLPLDMRRRAHGAWRLTVRAAAVATLLLVFCVVAALEILAAILHAIF